MPPPITYPAPNTSESRRLLALSRQIAAVLKTRSQGTRMRIRSPARTAVSWTGGWFATVGKIGKGSIRLEIWLDHYSGHRDRKLWAGFHSRRGHDLRNITRRVHRKLWPRRTITSEDATVGTYW